MAEMLPALEALTPNCELNTEISELLSNKMLAKSAGVTTVHSSPLLTVLSKKPVQVTELPTTTQAACALGATAAKATPANSAARSAFTAGLSL